MRYKSEAIITLGRIKQDVGVSNKIFTENSPAQIGYNTEMRILTREVRTGVCTT